jgi:hypothetical protein
MMRKLLTSVVMFAEFLNLVYAFGSKTILVEETFARHSVYCTDGILKSFGKISYRSMIMLAKSWILILIRTLLSCEAC